MSSLRIPTLVFAFFAAVAPVAAVTITSLGVPVTEDFNTLASVTATPSTSSALPAGWRFLETGSAFNTTYTAGTGNSTTGDTYSFGSTSAVDRALGMLQSGSLVSTIGAVVTNSTGGVITSLAISYFGEQWRLGALTRTDRLDFEYSTNASSLSTGTWTIEDLLDFTAPVSTGTVGALDGNLAANRTAISFTITGLSLANGASLWLRWTDFNATGFDDGLGIDDFSIMAPGPQGVPDQLPLAFATALLGGLFLAAKRRVFRG